MSPNPEQRAQIIIGDDAEEFTLTELGRTMLGMAEQDEKAALIAFADADVTDEKLMLKIQQDLRVARAFPQYLSELVMRGREVLDSLREKD